MQKVYFVKMRRNVVFIVLLALLIVGCRGKGEPERVAERWLSAYLECRFDDAQQLSAKEGSVIEQMRWRASQLTQAEVELLAENKPTVEAEDVEPLQVPNAELDSNTKSCVVTLMVHDALLLDSIGLPAHIGEQRYRLVLQKEKGRNWKVTALNP